MEKKPNYLEDEIERLHKELQQTDPTFDEYGDILCNLEKLYKQSNAKAEQRLKVKDWMPVAANAALGIMVIFAENTRAVTSKAMQFISKGIRL